MRATIAGVTVIFTAALVAAGGRAPAAAHGPGDPNIAFTDATAATGLVHVHHEALDAVPPLFEGQNTRFGIGAAVGDYDNDGDHDVYLPDSYGFPGRLFRNDGGVFTDVTDHAGVADLGMGHMGLFVDLDDDGWDDLVVLNDCSAFTEQFPCSQIFRNDGDGTFTNVTDGSGFRPVDPTFGGMTAGDYDLDGDLDLYVVGWYGHARALFRNDGGFRFSDVTKVAGLLAIDTDLFQWTPVFADVDGDGLQDIFCAVDFDQDYLFRNNGDGTFTDVSKDANVLHLGNDMGVAVADIDDDGDVDFYTTNISGDAQYEGPGCNWLYLNDGTGRFEDAAAEYGIQDTRWGWGTWCFDADLDGDRDLLAVNGWTQVQWITPAQLFRNDGGPPFVEIAEAAGIAHVANTRGLTPFDLEGDGDIDFIMGDVLGPVVVYENVTARADRHWLVVAAEGTTSNRRGVGSKVVVTAGGRTLYAEIVVGGSFYAAPPVEAHFGLGAADVVDEVVVTFPTGRRVVLHDVAADRRLVVVEPALSCAADQDDDGGVGFADLLLVLAAWGPCDRPCPADLDASGAVDALDLDALIEAWGPCG